MSPRKSARRAAYREKRRRDRPWEIVQNFYFRGQMCIPEPGRFLCLSDIPGASSPADGSTPFQLMENPLAIVAGFVLS